MRESFEYFGAQRKERQEKRSSNREQSAKLLTDAGVRFESKNDGAHLVVTVGHEAVDFWPGTGLWIVRGLPARHRGVMKLLAYIRKGGTP